MTKTDSLESTIGKLPQATNGKMQVAELLRQYGCGPIPFVGTENAFYERHLIFDRVIDPEVATARERFEAFARSIRDILAQRWVLTKKTYERENAKRIYYLSMEFLIGRSTATNVTNLLLDPLVQHAAKEAGIDWLNLIEEEPDAGLGNGGLGRLAACFLESMATMQLPATGYGLRYEYGMFRQSIANGWQKENADNWLRQADPWEVPRPPERVEVKLNCSIQVRGGQFEVTPGRPSTLVWHSVRSAGGGLRREDDQHSAPVGRGSARIFSFRRVRERRLHRSPRRDAGSGITDPRIVPG